ncbi:hypothetical protein HPB49_003579 [Dermacentor silvarum]|uniref:Uncharacterized protein n=1 Tax=Dermacentor silvarum TaxID=543639 RepID=A0ACB8DTS2_DERSI|nr:hypothetical protein HPB49_003579 [Dermacentor silvarum]
MMSSLVLFPTQPEGRTVAQQEDEMRALMQRLREMRSSRKRELRRLRSEEADLCHTLEEPEFAFGNEGSLPSQEELNELRERLHALKHEKALRTYKFRALQRERVAQLHLVGAVPDTQFEREIVDSPETFIISLRNLEKAAAYLQKLKELANARREEITALMKELNIFWDRLDVPEEQQLGHPTGLAAEVIDTLKELANARREEITALMKELNIFWDRLDVPEEQQLGHPTGLAAEVIDTLKELANARREEITALMKELNIFWDRLDVPEEQQLRHPTGLAAEVIDTLEQEMHSHLKNYRGSKQEVFNCWGDKFFGRITAQNEANSLQKEQEQLARAVLMVESPDFPGTTWFGRFRPCSSQLRLKEPGRYVGRTICPSTATGSKYTHKKESEKLLNDSFACICCLI